MPVGEVQTLAEVSGRSRGRRRSAWMLSSGFECFVAALVWGGWDSFRLLQRCPPARLHPRQRWAELQGPDDQKKKNNNTKTSASLQTLPCKWLACMDFSICRSSKLIFLHFCVCAWKCCSPIISANKARLEGFQNSWSSTVYTVGLSWYCHFWYNANILAFNISQYWYQSDISPLPKITT